jgi:hypothetical protein
MNWDRRLPVIVVVFSAAYALLYAAAVNWNLALFTYHPALGTFGWLTTPAQAGPSMYWYGWMSTAALGAAALAVLAAFILWENAARRLWTCLAWAVPAVAMLVFAFLLRGFFLR